MNLDNRRLREIQQEKRKWGNFLENADSIEESLLYQGKLECLEREEKEILERSDV